MNECDLAVDEAAHENVVAVANRLREVEDLLASRMRPPASANEPASDGGCERGHWTRRRLEDDAVLTHERSSLTRSQSSRRPTGLVTTANAPESYQIRLSKLWRVSLPRFVMRPIAPPEC